jgi:N-acetylglucosamine-6-sulfatase
VARINPFLFFRAAIIALAVGCIGGEGPGGELRTPDDKRPNVILLLVDDLRHDEFGFSGYPVNTPNIDALARGGARFENAFVTSSLCSPSRASFLTGVYPHTHGVVGNKIGLDIEKTPTIGSLLQAEGYRTAMIGKWHMGANAAPRPGFDHWFSMRSQGEYFDPVFHTNGDKVQVKGYNTDVITDEAVEFIEQNRDYPFYLHLGYKSVHDPFEPAPRHKGTLEADSFRIQSPSANGDWRDLRHKRAETLLAVDESVGRIMAALKANDLHNTLVLFTSDNGFLYGEHGFGDKRLFYEESMRVPWLVHYPGGAIPGSILQEHVLNIDFVPTVLDLAGADIPGHIQGRSFAPLLKQGGDKAAMWRDHWVYEYFNEVEFMHIPTHFAVVDTRYKYVRFPEGPALFRYFTGKDLLFDLREDPFELNNLATEADQRERLERMHAQLLDFARDTDLRFFDLDPQAVNERIDYLYNDPLFLWIRRAMDKAYPEGFPGWTPPQRQPL